MPVLVYIVPILLLSLCVFISVKAGKLTLLGGITGGLVAMVLYAGAGYTGIAILAAFFILGTLATSWKKQEKQLYKAVDDRSSKRRSGQVLANGGVAALSAGLALLLPNERELFNLMGAASLSAATADTLSSELGMVYGRRFYNIITLKSEQKGLDGVISLEGTLIGICGSILIAVIYAIGNGCNKNMLFIIIAGTIGNLSDSVLGALFERKKYLGNDMVNFLNTLIAVLIAYLLFVVF